MPHTCSPRVRSGTSPAVLSTASFAALALSLACSGGSSSPPDYEVQFAASSSTVTEGGAPLSVDVVLKSRKGALPQALTLSIADSSDGTASSGTDFTPLPEQLITFPAGALDGDVRSIAVQALDDTLIEGADETVRLTLAHSSGPGTAGARRAHTVSIVDDDFATVQFETTASATVDESSADFPVAVELSLPVGATLATSVVVRITDSAAGSAHSGTDYTKFTATNLTIPAGTLGGALFPVMLHVKPDTNVEGDETVILSMAPTGPGVVIGANATHAVTIHDDDGAALGELEVTDHSHAPLNSAATYDIGSQSIGAGPSAGLLLHVHNTGIGALALETPYISGHDEREFSIEVDPSTFALPPPGSPLAAATPVAQSPLALVATDEVHGATLAFDTAANAALAHQKRVVLTDFAMPDAAPVALQLERVPSPWTADARVVVDGHAPAGGVAALLGDLTLWRGRVAGDEGSSVFLALSSEGARGWIQRGDTGELVHVLAMRDGSGASLAVREAQLAAGGVHAPSDFCATPESPLHSAMLGASSFTNASTLAECRMALESDFQLYQQFGSTNQLVQYVTELVAAASARYSIDIQTKLSIAYLGVHSQANDGWTTPDSPGTTSQMLDEFRTAWSPLGGSGWPAQANLAHFLSGAALGGGVAYVGVLCDQNFGFAVSGNLNSAIDWSSWTGASGPLTWDFVVFAHETGHNFGASHTHAYCPPLDQCYGNCTGVNVCSQGTLMSYCHLCAGGMSNIVLMFHPFVANVMRGGVNTSCLQPASLARDEELTWRVRFDPDTGAVPARHTTLSFGHDAPNAPSPFTLELAGTALP